MISGEGNENSQNKSVGLISKKKKKNFAREAHFFIHFFVVVLHDHNVKLGQKLPSYKFMGDMLYVFLFPFFRCNSIFTLLAASISHFFTAAITFSRYSSNKIGLLCFLSLALALSLLSTSM